MTSFAPLHSNPPGMRQRGGIILKLLFLVMVLAVLGVLYLLRAPLLRAVGNAWVVDEASVPADVIIVLSDDNYPGERASRAAELFRAGWAPRVVASGRMLRPYAGIGDLMQRDLVERGVPREAVEQYQHRAGTTRNEAYMLRHLINQRGWRRILVVTSNYHTRRARYIWRRVLAPGIEVRVVAASDSDFDPNAWWRSRIGLKAFFYEAFSFGVAIWEMQGEEPQPPGTASVAPAHR